MTCLNTHPEAFRWPKYLMQNVRTFFAHLLVSPFLPSTTIVSQPEAASPLTIKFLDCLVSSSRLSIASPLQAFFSLQLSLVLLSRNFSVLVKEMATHNPSSNLPVPARPRILTYRELKFNRDLKDWCKNYVWPVVDPLVDAGKDTAYIMKKVNAKFDQLIAVPKILNYCLTYENGIYDLETWRKVSSYSFIVFLLIYFTLTGLAS